MIKICILLSLLSSNVFAVVETSSTEINEKFPVSENIIKLMAQRVANYSEEELGELTEYKCAFSDLIVSCNYKYDLSEDYCWYGHFKAKVDFTMSDPGFEILDYFVEWSE